MVVKFFEGFLFDEKRLLAGKPLFCLDKSHAIDGPEFPVKRTVLQIEEQCLAADGYSWHFLGRLGPFFKNMFICAGLETMM